MCGTKIVFRWKKGKSSPEIMKTIELCEIYIQSQSRLSISIALETISLLWGKKTVIAIFIDNNIKWWLDIWIYFFVQMRAMLVTIFSHFTVDGWMKSLNLDLAVNSDKLAEFLTLIADWWIEFTTFNRLSVRKYVRPTYRNSLIVNPWLSMNHENLSLKGILETI